MERHPYFDLLIHTDHELRSILDATILERRTLHEWPLSCVQCLELSDGRRQIYKAESGPTVEAKFYSQAHSPLLIQAQTIYQDERYSCMLFEHLSAPRLWDLGLPEKQVQQIGRELVAEIGRMEGTLPVFLDVSSWEQWSAVMSGVEKNLHDLVSGGLFRVVNKMAIERFKRTAASAPLRTAICGPSCLNHHDLAGDNVFVLPDGSYRVIDWQRPVRGPLGLDLAILAESFGYRVAAWVSPAVGQVFTLLRIHWLTECAVRWFPPGTETYDRTIAELAARL